MHRRDTFQEGVASTNRTWRTACGISGAWFGRGSFGDPERSRTLSYFAAALHPDRRLWVATECLCNGGTALDRTRSITPPSLGCWYPIEPLEQAGYSAPCLLVQSRPPRLISLSALLPRRRGVETGLSSLP
jgi:hypothetical protein